MDLASSLAHLRLPFQIRLAPLFLWGALLAGGATGTQILLGFVSLHLFLYPGATAFNAVYDRDRGPVSGMASPPPVPPGLLGVAIALQLGGALLAVATGPAFAAFYGAIALLFVAYSHPRLRWKAHPWLSALTIAVGQGALGMLAGWSAARGGDGLAGPLALVAASGTAFATLGFYPATQVFQVEEDAGRGDVTLARRVGPASALRFGSACLAAGAALTAIAAAIRFEPLDGLLVALPFAAAIVLQERLARILAGPGLPQLESWRRAARVGQVATAGFLLFIGYRIVAAGI